MPRYDDLSIRMKTYEEVSSVKLSRITPKIARVDGKAFHTLLRGAKKPFDFKVKYSMQAAIKAVMQEIGGICRLCYSQSDEASFLVNDFLDLNTEPYFDNNVQKLCSVIASIMSVNFTENYGQRGYFDARAYNIPVEDMNNYFVWRQKDAERNSINTYAQSKFPHKELQGKSIAVVREMLREQKGFNWASDAEPWTKRGFVLYRSEIGITLDEDIPVFTQDKEYIEKIYYNKKELK